MKNTKKLFIIPWDFIELKCGNEHFDEEGKIYHPDMIIKEGTAGAYYDCPDAKCFNRIPLLVYEKLLDMVTNVVNSGKGVKGYQWTEKISRQMYKFEVLDYIPEEKITIAITNLTIKKRGSEVLM